MMFIIDIQAQGLGMSKNEVYESRYNDKHTDGTFPSGVHFTTYDCDADQACLTTTYVYDNDIVVVVMDVFNIDIINETTDYLDSEYHQVKAFVWNDYKSHNRIEMRIDKQFNQFVLFYSQLKD